ncbi:hypothetical protein Tsubulata_038424 [Turnera subulata]|uniref:Rad60/SUMO-like domain-containing protein n=1 Tax=Turnera subulata TaxID=218843 RepID=A0A9Q0GDF0_9ROSI|nr:hypothetical protein Tsubulata_008512 [Turnera subulata]KAJ4846594.1 hypothetical protein Tsubulata_038424 [Turnera subulata]
MPGDGDENPPKNNVNKNQRIPISVQGQDGVLVDYKLAYNSQLSKLMDAYCKRKNLDAKVVEFLYNGQRLRRTSTPAELEMHMEGDQIEAVQRVHGGGGCKGIKRLAV